MFHIKDKKHRKVSCTLQLFFNFLVKNKGSVSVIHRENILGTIELICVLESQSSCLFLCFFNKQSKYVPEKLTLK